MTKICPPKEFWGNTMSPDFEGWSNLPKPIKLLDISIIGYGFVLSISMLLYLSILNHSVQNLILIFITAIILLFTWNLRNQLAKTMDFNTQRRYFIFWFVFCLLFISIFGIIVMIYPVSYWIYGYHGFSTKIFMD